MERWPIQIITFVFLILSTTAGTMLYHRNNLAKVCFAYILTWLYHALLFYTALMGRIVLYHDDPVWGEVLMFWGNVINLHLVLALLFTFISLLEVSSAAERGAQADE